MRWWTARRRDLASRTTATTAGTVVGLAVGGPVGAMVGAGAGVLLEPVMARMWDEIAADSREAAASVLVNGADFAAVTVDELASRVARTPRTRLLGGLALSAGSRTRDEAKAWALGRALASGVLSDDDARLDEEQLIVRALDDLEAPHVRVLDLIARHVPAGRTPRLWVSDGTDTGAPTRSWTRYALNEVAPGLAGGMHGLLGTLQRHGLVVEVTDFQRMFGQFRAASYREDSERRPDSTSRVFDRMLGRPEHLPSGFSASLPEWQPTPLGERVLDYLARPSSSPELDS